MSNHVETTAFTDSAGVNLYSFPSKFSVFPLFIRRGFVYNGGAQLEII
ncbi:hypothetical protein HMPREF0239_05012 [Clostridium sp. ATCC BAA-442]|nr:hypothetical protein HMPREF0239_05012 [Clostridium sp. ATCC BAA-442]